jgi:hypothetical protein
MGNNEGMKNTVQDWFSGLAAGFHGAGIQKLVTWYNSCVTMHGDTYIEK